MRQHKKVEPVEKDDSPEFVQGEILEPLPGFRFAVRLYDGRLFACFLDRYYFHRRTEASMAKVRLIIGDHVWVECSPFDEEVGKIIPESRVKRPTKLRPEGRVRRPEKP
jgi:translation initiation factor IF-1